MHYKCIEKGECVKLCNWMHVMSGMVLLAMGTSGCAFGTRQAALQTPTFAPVSGGVPATTPSRGTIILVTFDDQRSNKATIGEVRNGWGMHTADVKPDRDISQWVTQSVKAALEQDGYQVLEGKSHSQPGSTPVLRGDILTVYCTALFSYEGEVSFFAHVEKDGRQLVNNRYTGKGSAGLNWAATGSGYAASIESALKAGIAPMLADLHVALR
jgi:hypothetical protein